MDKVIASRKFLSDPISRGLFESLQDKQDALGLKDAIFYYDFPTFRDYEDESFRPHALLVAPHHGVIALNVCDPEIAAHEGGSALVETDESLTQFFSILFGRLIESRLLRRNRTELAFPFNAVLYAPGLRETRAESLKTRKRVENQICTSFQSLEQWLAHQTTERIDDDLIAEIRSIVEGAKAITRHKRRAVPSGQKQPKAQILASLEAEIANFDTEQRKAAITLLSGPERIRGLAGTGKTIVLAMKAAQLHLENPEKRVLFTFYTKSLYDLIKRLITRFYRHYRDADPNWDNVHVLHAWGGRNMAGVYQSTCLRYRSQPLTYADVPPNVSEPFGFVCKDLLSRVKLQPYYDYVLIDEAQDIAQQFFTLCFHLAQGDRDDKNIVWAYDELQNIFNVKLRSPRELFGTDNAGEPLIDLERAAGRLPSYLSNDVVLYKSYRNPKEVLLCAHALGFGVYSDHIVQMLENKEHWEDVGYVVMEGDFQRGAKTVIVRPDENSPLAVNGLMDRHEIIRHYSARELSDELGWIIDEVRGFIADGVRPDEILIVSLDDRNARTYFKGIEAGLLKHNIECNNVLDNPFTSARFALDGRVTLSTVHRAKGNEAAAVVAVGIDALYPLRNSRTGRNRIFTAFTRTKAWLRVSGVGDEASYFLKELALAVKNSPRLVFTFPDLNAVNLLQRDMNKRETKLRSLAARYKGELKRLGLSEEEMSEFFMSGEKK